MNIQRFFASTSREAMDKARQVFGEDAVILSSKSIDGGFEVMATSEESLANVMPGGLPKPSPMPKADLTERSALERPGFAQPESGSSVEDDTEAMAMSTLSFQDYVRERMLRKRREAMGGAPETPASQAAARQQAEQTAAPAQRQPQIHVPIQRFNQPQSAPQPQARPVTSAQAPAPIRTRPVAPPSSPTLAMPPVKSGGGQDGHVQVELNALKDMIEERFNTLAWLGSSKQNPIQSGMMLKLIRGGFSPSMSKALLERLPAELDAAGAMRWIMDVIVRNLKVAGAGQTLCEEGGVVSLVGATGVGKTTTAAKLAAQCIQMHGAGSVGLITLDSYRVSGYEQLRTYGRMIGVVAHLAHDRAALKDLLGLLSNKRMVIIDTAGLGQRDQRLQDMLDMLEMPQVKKTLVLNAGSHGDTIDDVLRGFKAKKLHGVILSKVDEAVKLGPALDSLIRHQVTLRGVANGQRVPEDWQNPDAPALVRASMATNGKSAFDPTSAEMGLYFGAFSGETQMNMGALNV
ncbi:flagellar biosynthesis protein FlhF [Hydrogenophaga sp. 5NK40-0174]|uniref:flagellar biosynthesis protein FlhF n=1 Tax=Hydrogenophaga sp. 5NK40-0174 TaxID=3127649 RepID=UPI003106C104